MNEKKVQLLIKRIFDICFAIIILLILSPIILITAMIIKIKSPESPVIFTQQRPGYKCKIFKIYKLRTMTNEKDSNGILLPAELRLKKWGKIIRKLNIDELPQMVNVIKGEMSLIGPRPVLPCDVEKFNEEQRRRHDVLPGISGWEAVNEWHIPTWEDKFRYDLYYVDNWSLGFDIKIFFMTIYVVLLAKRPDESYRPTRFEGNKEEKNSEDI